VEIDQLFSCEMFVSQRVSKELVFDMTLFPNEVGIMFNKEPYAEKSERISRRERFDGEQIISERERKGIRMMRG
jgi:hypothetical protein